MPVYNKSNYNCILKEYLFQVGAYIHLLASDEIISANRAYTVRLDKLQDDYKAAKAFISANSVPNS